MGGGNSFINKPLGSTGDNILGKNNFFTDVLNTVASGTAGGKYGMPALTKVGIGALGEGLGEITGANALRKEAMDQRSANEAETKRQAAVSDAMARSAGGDPTSIFLSGNRKRKSGGGGSTGSAGTGNSRETGVQS